MRHYILALALSTFLVGCASGVASILTFFRKNPYKIYLLDPDLGLKRKKGKDLLMFKDIRPAEYACMKTNMLQAYINKCRVGKPR